MQATGFKGGSTAFIKRLEDCSLKRGFTFSYCLLTYFLRLSTTVPLLCYFFSFSLSLIFLSTKLACFDSKGLNLALMGMSYTL